MKKAKAKKKKVNSLMWRSIDEMPIFNWFRLHKTNDLRFMFKKERKGYDKKMKLELVIGFMVIRDEYIDRFGLSKELKQILMLEADIQALKIKLFLTKDRIHNTFIRAKQFQLESLKKDIAKGEDPMLTKSRVEKFMGFRLNEKEVTVSEYYTYIELIKQQPKPKQAKPHGN